MKTLIRFLIKIIPIITLWQGLTNGSTRIGPLKDAIKVSLTQYEVIEISKTLTALLKDRTLQINSDFADFINSYYHNQYSILAREYLGQKDHQLDQDIWGQKIIIFYHKDQGQLIISSNGPDKMSQTKDDISFAINIQTNSKKTSQSPQRVQPPKKQRRDPLRQRQNHNQDDYYYDDPYQDEAEPDDYYRDDYPDHQEDSYDRDY